MKTLQLLHGEVALPAFFPDGTYGSVRCVDGADLGACAVPGVVMNTFHLLNRPGVQTVRSVGGLHAFSGWDGPILTDSGGFQVFSLIRENPARGTIRPGEVIFQPEGGKGKIHFSPAKCIQAQFAFGADILMCLDHCTHPDDPWETSRASVDTTVRWAAACRREFDRLAGERWADRPRPRLFAIIQGGGDRELRRECAQALTHIGFDGYGYGGWPMNSAGELVDDILAYTAQLMPDGLPKYAMGVGKPEEIVRCCAMGYDLFDCVIPTREARHHRLYVWNEDTAPDGEGRFYHYHYVLDEAHRRDGRPVDPGCDCPCCRHHSRAYLRHLFKVGDTLAYRLATLHNLRFFSRLMERLRHG